MDSTEKQRSRTSTSTLFDSSNNLYNNNSGSGGTIHPLHEIRRRPSPSLQSDTMSQSSNNNTTTNEEEESGLCSVFEKLKTDDQRRNSSPGSKLSEDMLKTASHRSMSVDVGSVHNPNHYQKLNSASSSTTTRTSNNSNNNNNNNNNSNNNTANSTNIQNLLSKNLLFDGEAHQSNDMFPTTPRNDPYFRSRYAGSTEKLSSPLLNKDNNSNNDNASTTSNSTTTTSTSYNGLFPSSSALDLASSLRRNSARQNKSVESLRSKSWAQYLENADVAPFEDSSLPNARAQAAFYGPPRRFSYGCWPPTTTTTTTSSSPGGSGEQRQPYLHHNNNNNNNMKYKNNSSRLTASQSYSDLHGAALRSYHHQQQQQQQQHPTVPNPHYSQGTMHDALLAAAAAAANTNKDVSGVPCPQYHQFGFCMLEEQCPYAHHHPLLDNNNNNNNNNNMDPLPPHSPQLSGGMPTLPFYHPSSIYHPYSMLHNLASPSSQFKSLSANNNLTPSHPYQQQQQQQPGRLDSTASNTSNAAAMATATHQQQQQGVINNMSSNNSTTTTATSTTTGKALSRRGSPATSSSSIPSSEEQNRFTGAKLEDFLGKIYELCKDQNGCRFLQKKLEELDRQQIQLIFEEVQPHFVELMTEPFGNYLCQKLIEHCDDSQRDILVDTVAPDLLKISLNMHGTRAVQRFIEFLSTPQQIRAVTVALNPNVVTLIKDLNGNHVIQKCLHRLSAEHKQFIYDAVSENCIQVATHRHGCCVLQRCIDYAAENQKNQLVKVITWHALPLVQDPFGNYVVQYVLDLGDITYTDTLVRCFLEHVCDLSVQKFSSNVIEKCIRVSEPETRRLLVAELLNETNIEKLLRDSFANYVVQTCLEYADQDQRVQLVEYIRPLLPSIRSTPYGKRIHSKIQREQPQQGRQRGIRQHQSLGSLRYGNTNNSFGYQNGEGIAFGLPLIGNNSDPLYPYP